MPENFEKHCDESLLPEEFSAVHAADTVRIDQDFRKEDGISV
jgi:hypothetical protein